MRRRSAVKLPLAGVLRQHWKGSSLGAGVLPIITSPTEHVATERRALGPARAPRFIICALVVLSQ